METEDIYTHVKRKFLDPDLKYPEKALYKNYVTFNARFWLDPTDVSLSYGIYGISVIPDRYDHDKHDGLILKIVDSSTKNVYSSGTFLSHEIYLSKLVVIMWEYELKSIRIEFHIECVAKNEVLIIK